MKTTLTRTTRSRRLPDLPSAASRHWLEIGLALIGLAYGAYLLYLVRDAWFWGDDWHFLFHRGTVEGAATGGLFDPFNGHWSTIMVLVYRALFDTFGLASYLPWAAVLVSLYLAVVAAVYWLGRKAGCSRPATAITAWLLLFVGVAPEMVVYDAAMNHTGSLACGLVAVGVLMREDLPGRALVAVWALLVLALMWSGTGIALVGMASVFALVERGWSAAFSVGSIPTAVFASWYWLEGRAGQSFGHSDDLLSDSAQYIWAGLTRVYGAAVTIPEAGPVIFLAIVISLATDRSAPSSLRNLGWSGLAAASLQLFLESLTRGTLGVDHAATGRYGYFTFVLLSPAVAMAVERLRRSVVGPSRLPAVAAVLLLVGYAAVGVSSVRQYAAGYTGVSSDWLNRVEGMLASSDAGQRTLTTDYDDGLNRGLSPDLVADPAVRPLLPDSEASPTDRLYAEMMFNVGVATETYGLFQPAFLDLSWGWDRKAHDGPGCRTYTATLSDPMLQLATGEGNEIGITSDATQVTTVLQRDGDRSDGRIWNVEPGSIHIASTAKNAVLIVSFNAGGDYVICKQ